MKSTPFLGHFLAIITIIIWGTTFISSKVLLRYLSPSEIVLVRFFIAWLALLVFYPKISRPTSLRQELMFFASGLFGVSLYLISENTALAYTLTSNVSLLVTTSPIITTLFAHLLTRDEKLRRNNIYGFVFAILGVFLVIFSGSFILRLSPLGDLLALFSAAVWSVYSLLLKRLGNSCHYIVATRKTFFYGIITTLPFVLYGGFNLTPARILNLNVLPNMLFLSLAASSLGFVLWNRAANLIGIIKTSNYIYLIPLVTIVTAALVLDERLTPVAVAGAVMILFGVYVSDKGFRLRLPGLFNPPSPEETPEEENSISQSTSREPE